MPDLKEIKDQDLENKLHELTKKYWIAARGGNGHLGQQILVALESYKEEMRRRQVEQTRSLMEKQNKDLDDLIK
jgi:hypothetical protein